MEEELASTEKQEKKKPVSRKKRLRTTGFVVGGLIVLLVFLHFFTVYLIGTLLQNGVHKATSGQYELVYENLSINWLEKEVYLEEFSYRKVPGQPGADTMDIYGLNVNLLEIQLDEFLSIYFRKSLRINKILINYPEFMLVKRNFPKNTSFSLETGDLYKALSGFIHSFQIGSLEINEMSARYKGEKDGKLTRVDVPSVSFTFTNISFDSAAISSKSEFLFTESLDLIIKRQKVLVPDSIHYLYFDSLKLSTGSNFIEVYNLRIDTLPGKQTLIDEGLYNIYHYHTPYLAISGLDFDRAYRDNVLHIDSILFDKPHIEIVNKKVVRKEIRNKPRNVVKNNVAELILDFFDRIELDNYFMRQVFFDMKLKNGERAHIEELDLAFYGFAFDSTDLSKPVYYPVYDNLEFRIRKPFFTLPGNIYEIKASDLTFSTFDSSLVIRSPHLASKHDEEALKRSAEAGIKQVLDIRSDSLVIKGIRLREIYVDKRIYLDSLLLYRPDINLYSEESVINKTEREKKKFSEQQLYELIKDSYKSIVISVLEVRKGRMQAYFNNEVSDSSKHVIKKLDVALYDVRLDSLSGKRNRIALSKSLNIDLRGITTRLRFMKHDISVGRLWFSTVSGTALANNVRIKPYRSGKRNNIEYDADIGTFRIRTYDFKGLLNGRINLNELTLKDADIVRSEFGETAIKSDSVKLEENKKSLAQALDYFSVKNVNINNVNILVKKSGFTAIKINDIYSQVKLMKANPEKLKNDTLEFKIIDILLGGKKVFMPLRKNGHLLTIEQFDYNDQDTIAEITGLNIMPIPGFFISDTIAKLNIYVPRLRISEFNPDKRYTTRVSAGIIQIDTPRVSIVLPSKKSGSRPSEFNLPEHLPEKFLDGAVDTIDMKAIAINHAEFIIEKPTDSTRTITRIGDFNFNAEDFFISSKTKWRVDRFLWFKNLKINASELDLGAPEFGGCREIDSITYSFLPNNFSIHGIYLTNENTTVPSVRSKRVIKYSSFINHMSIIDFNLFEYLTDSVLHIGEIEAGGGMFEASIYPANNRAKDTVTTQRFQLPDSIPADLKGFNRIDVGVANFKRMDIRLSVHSDKGIVPIETDSFHLQVNNFSISPGEKMKPERLLFSDDIRLKFSNLYTLLDSGLMELGADKLLLSTGHDSLAIEGITFVPTVYKYEYAIRKGYQKTVLNVHNEKLVMSDVDYYKLLFEKEINIRFVRLQNLNLNALKDKRMPEKNIYKPLYSKYIREFKWPLMVDSVEVDSMHVLFEGFSKNGRVPGAITVSDIGIKIRNVTNKPEVLNKDSIMSVIGHGLLTESGRIDLWLSMNLKSKTDEFFMRTTLGEYDPTELNDFLEPYVSMEILSGHVNNMEMYAYANEDYAVGKMGLFYQNLKFRILNTQNLQKKGGGARFKSFIGNTLVKSRNRDIPFKPYKEVYYERDKYKALINYLIKINLSGVASNMGIKNYKQEIKKLEQREDYTLPKLDDKALRKAEKKAVKENKKLEKRNKANAKKRRKAEKKVSKGASSIL